MMLTLLPTTAYAAVGDLLDNSPAENQALLQQLEELTGQDAATIQAFLEQYGLLDENGNLVTDRTIDLDGVSYTLEEMEALLSDPATDLSRVGYVDGVPISLGDLKTIIAIERELQRIQETYFSGKTFEGEALANLNNLMAQLQSEGITLNTGAVGSTSVVDVSGFASVAAGSSVSASFQGQADVTYSVDVRFDAGLAGLDSVTVSLGSDRQTLNSGTSTVKLTCTPSSAGAVTLEVQAGSNTNTPEHAYGDLTGAVQFTNPVGFVFQNGNTYTDAFTLKVYKNVTMPNLSATYTGRHTATTQNDLVPYDSNVGIELFLDQENIVTPLESLIQLLQETRSASKGEISSVSYDISMSISQSNSKQHNDPENPYPGCVAIGYAASDGANTSAVKAEPSDISITSISAIEQDPYDPGSETWRGYPYHMWPNSSYDITIFARDTAADFQVPMKISLMNVQVAEQDGNDKNPLESLTITYNSQSVTLANDGDDPTCTATALTGGTYRTGQRVPVLLTFDELVKVNESGTVMNINGKNFSAADLWMSNTAGTSLLVWYPVQQGDGTQLSITSASGITDVFGNGVSLNTTVEGVNLEGLILRFAPTGLNAGAYNEETGVTFTVDVNHGYDTPISNYDNGQTAPFQVVVQDGAETYTRQVKITEDETFTTDPLTIPRKQQDTTYTAVLQVNMGTKEEPDWVDASWISANFTVPAYVDVESVTVTADKPEVKELSLGGDYIPTLTAEVKGTGGKTPTATSGTWKSSDDTIAAIRPVEGNPLQIQVVPTGQKLGDVTITFTADNGTDDVTTDDRSGSLSYTVTAGDSLALTIPTAAATIVTRKNAPAKVLWISNASQFAPGKTFDFTIKLYQGNFQTEEELDEKFLVGTYTVGSDKNSFEIPTNVLTELSTGSTPAYTVRVSMPHPDAATSEIELSALAWIVVQPVPAKAILTPPENLYVLDTAGTVQIPWAVENRDEAAAGQTVKLTVTRVTGDNQSTTETQTLSGASGTYTLNLAQVAGGNLKDTYQIMLSVNNPGEETPSTDSFPLYVYNGDALQLQKSDGTPLNGSLTMDNTSKVNGELPTKTAEIMNLRQTLSLIEYVNINYKDYNWNTYLDGIKWATTNDDVVSVNYKQGGLYENIKLFGYETYLPGTTMALSSTVDGTATITATHAKTGMSDTVTVDVATLRNKFFLFQVSPAKETTLRYVDGSGEEKTVKTNDQGVLALYEPNGIASDVWLSSGNKWQNDEYAGTLYRQNLQSGEQNATMLQLYPLNTVTLRPVAKAELTLLEPDGSPLANTQITVRGGVFKNGSYCETSGIGKDRDSITTGADQKDVIFTTDSTGKIVVYFDATQFWSAAAGENENTQLLPTDQIRYVLEIRNIENNTYYPVFQTVNASASVEQEMRTASGVVVLEEVPSGEADKPFVAQQIVDYGLDNGVVLDVRTSTGKAGPTKTYPEATLVTTMFLWGMDSADGQNCDLKITDENGYIPSNQTSSVSRYPFTSIPVVENTISLTAETMTDSGWISDGKDMGVKTRLTKSGTLVGERTLPFRVMDLTRIPAVNEEEDISQMLVTLTTSAAVSQANFKSDNLVMQGLSGVLNGLSGPIDSSVFKMIITPTNDPTVFNALIWAGYDSLELEDVDYVDGIAFETDYLNQKLEVGVPGVNDLANMANGTYNPSQTLQQSASKVTSADAELQLQLTGYYEAEIRYNLEQQKWEIYTTGGGFTAGVGMEIGFTVNASVGPVPVTGSFGVGGAIQLDFQTAVRYSQQGNNIWSDPDATAVNDYLTNLRINAYVKAFGGVGFDFSVIALKIGLYGELGVDSQNKFLSRTYLQNSGDRQLNGQHLQTTGEVGIKFVAKFLFVSYELNLVSAGFSSGASFNNWNTIEDYWNSATSGLSLQSLQYAAALNGMQVVSASATLQSLDYLEAYARSWGQPQTRAALFSLDENNGLANLQTNANPNSYPEISDDGQVLVYVNDGYSDSNKTPSIYDSRAHYSTLSGGSYSASTAISDPDDFTGYGDSDVDIAGSSSFAAASWVRMSSDLPGKDAGDAVSVEEQNLLMNSAEIVASIYSNGIWTSTRLTTNGTPDLAPAVASNGTGRAVVFWRSVYSADPENGLMDFTAQDQILYSVYEDDSWSEAKTLYNGSNGSVKALEAAMLPDGTAVAVYTLDKSGTGDTTQYEVGYTIVNADDNGSLGTSMLVTSDKYLDENPQVVSASFGGDDRFVIAWHSLRNDVSDIQMLAVDKKGIMSNSFPASLSEITSDGSAAVSASFRLATLSGSYRDVTNLTVIWDETVENHSVLKAARLRSNGSTGYVLSAPMELATLGNRTMADHFEAYVSGDNQVKAIIQATQYGTDIENDTPQTTLYTATSQFALDAVEVEAIVPDYAKLALESMVAVQFVVRNTGLNNVENLTVTMGSGETATLDQTLLPNQSATLIVLHQIGDTVENASYIVKANNISESGTVYLDYPDIGISRMEVLKEEGGQRTVSMTLYNASAATLAGKGREVKLAFYTDNLLTENANVTYNGVSSSNTVTISDEADLKRIDEGSFTLEVTYDVGAYVKGQGLSEIPDSGVYLYADAWVEGKIGTQSGNQRLPEYSSADNQASVLLTGALARTGKASTLNVEQGLSGGVTTAAVTLTNNSLQSLNTPTLVATLLDENGQPLETVTTDITGDLSGETARTSNITFSKAGSRVTVQALTGEDSLTFEGLPVSMDDFTPSEDGTLTYTVSGISANGTLVTAASGSGGKVSINGTESDGAGSLYVPIGTGTTVITVTIGAKTYVLNITSTHSSGGGGVSSYKITVTDSENGTVTANRTSASRGTTVTLTAAPDEGYQLASLAVTNKDGKAIALHDQGNGQYTFTMPASPVTVKATFAPIGSGALPFVDVPTDAYFYDSVGWAVSNGITNGTTDTTFSPDKACTRAQTMTFLWRAAGCPEPRSENNPFVDVSADAYYYDAVLWAVEQGITNGTTDTTFSPDATVTRAQTMAFLWRYAGSPEAGGTSFTDVAVDAYYATAVAWAADKGITSGTTATTFNPNDPCTRAQIVTFLYRAQ